MTQDVRWISGPQTFSLGCFLVPGTYVLRKTQFSEQFSERLLEAAGAKTAAKTLKGLFV